MENRLEIIIVSQSDQEILSNVARRINNAGFSCRYVSDKLT
jgi:hypothetical protein